MKEVYDKLDEVEKRYTFLYMNEKKYKILLNKDSKIISAQSDYSPSSVVDWFIKASE